MASTPYLGEILLVPYVFAPNGWAFCNGQILPIAQYTALFSLLGTTYGGNGLQTFALPDFRGRVPIHAGATYNLGDQPGTTTNTVTSAQLPTHNHSLNGKLIIPQGFAASSSSPVGNVPVSNATPAFSPYVDEQMQPLTTADLLGPNLSTLPTGSGQAYDNMMPYQVLNYIIALYGTFPSFS